MAESRTSLHHEAHEGHEEFTPNFFLNFALFGALRGENVRFYFGLGERIQLKPLLIHKAALDPYKISLT